MTASDPAPQPIKPCPFCGGVGKVRTETDDNDARPWRFVECQKCGAEGEAAWWPEAAAIAAWNARRAPPPTPAGREAAERIYNAVVEHSEAGIGDEQIILTVLALLPAPPPPAEAQQELAALRAFWLHVLESRAVFEHGDLQDWAEEAGLLIAEPYSPGLHGPHDGEFQEGDRIYVPVKWPTTAPIAPDGGLPIPMLLWCPDCAQGHFDEGEWATKPHRTHRCLSCGGEWRPANVATVGVRELPAARAQGGKA